MTNEITANTPEDRILSLEIQLKAAQTQIAYMYNAMETIIGATQRVQTTEAVI